MYLTNSSKLLTTLSLDPRTLAFLQSYVRKWEVNTNSYFSHRGSLAFSRKRSYTFFKLSDEVRILICDGTHKKFILREKLNDFSWLCKIAYLADLLTHLNVLNLKLQGPDINIFVVEDKIEAMLEKL